MTKRAMILMRDVVFGSPALELAGTWNLPSKVLKGSAFEDLIACVTAAARVLKSDYPNPFVQIVEIIADDDTAAQYMMNLRMQNDDKEILAFWFDSNLEAKVAAWRLAVPAIDKLTKSLTSAKGAASKLYATEKNFKMKFSVRTTDFSGLLKSMSAEFGQVAADLQNELRSCVI